MAQGAIAPFFRLSEESGTIMSGSMRISWPSPSQAGQAPKGLLKENRRGSISGIVKPETGQANFDEKTMRRGEPSSSFSSAYSKTAMPSVRFERLLQRVGQTRAEIGPDHKAIDDDVDVMLELLVERGRIGDLVRIRR